MCAIFFSHFVLYPDYRISFFIPLAFRFADYTLSAILFWFFFKFLPRKKQVVFGELLLLISFICSIIHVSFLSLIIYVSDYLPPFFSYAINKGLRYLGSESSYGFKQILPLLLYLYIAYVQKRKGLFVEYYLIFLFVIILMLQLNQAVTLARIGQMYLTVIILYIPILMKNLLLKQNVWIVYFATIIYCFYTFIRVTFFNTGGFINVY